MVYEMHTQLGRPTKRQNACWKLNGKDDFICPTTVRSLQCYFLLCNFENPCSITWDFYVLTNEVCIFVFCWAFFFVAMQNTRSGFILFKIGCRFLTDCTFSLEILAKPHYMGNLSTSRCTLWNQAQSFFSTYLVRKGSDLVPPPKC